MFYLVTPSPVGVQRHLLVRNIKTRGLPLAGVFSPSAPSCENRQCWFFPRLQVILKISRHSWLLLRFGYRGVVNQPHLVAPLVLGVCVPFWAGPCVSELVGSLVLVLPSCVFRFGYNDPSAWNKMLGRNRGN